MRLWNLRGEQKTVTEALCLELPDHTVISVTGAGGKTTLICAWARELASSGKKTVITTTTHMLHPAQVKDSADDPYSGIEVIYSDPSCTVPDAGLCDAISRALEAGRPAMVVSPDPGRPEKVMSPPEWVFSQIYAGADVVLVEADGSRRMPLKWPAPWEPAVPEKTDFTVCVAGLSALGCRTEDVMYGTEYIPKPYLRDVADEQFVSAVLSSADGGLKGSRGDFRVFLNQADSDDLLSSASQMQMLLAVRGIQSAWGTFKY